MDRIEDKTTDCNELGVKQQPQFVMPLIFFREPIVLIHPKQADIYN
jgi:hypothetical protein